MIDLINMIFGVCALVGICWMAVRSGLLVRGLDYTNSDRAEDDAALTTIRDELERQEGCSRKVRAGTAWGVQQ